jgi:hypothetical protein
MGPLFSFGRRSTRDVGRSLIDQSRIAQKDACRKKITPARQL